MAITIKEYLDKQKSPQKEVCEYLRELIIKTLPCIKEEIKWGAIVFGGGKFYIGSLRNSVNLGFSVGGLSDKEMNLFEGKGKTMKHLKFTQIKDVDNKKIVKLLKLVDAKTTCDNSC